MADWTILNIGIFTVNGRLFGAYRGKQQPLGDAVETPTGEYCDLVVAELSEGYLNLISPLYAHAVTLGPPSGPDAPFSVFRGWRDARSVLSGSVDRMICRGRSSSVDAFVHFIDNLTLYSDLFRRKAEKGRPLTLRLRRVLGYSMGDGWDVVEVPCFDTWADAYSFFNHGMEKIMRELRARHLSNIPDAPFTLSQSLCEKKLASAILCRIPLRVRKFTFFRIDCMLDLLLLTQGTASSLTLDKLVFVSGDVISGFARQVRGHQVAPSALSPLLIEVVKITSRNRNTALLDQLAGDPRFSSSFRVELLKAVIYCLGDQTAKKSAALHVELPLRLVYGAFSNAIPAATLHAVILSFGERLHESSRSQLSAPGNGEDPKQYQYESIILAHMQANKIEEEFDAISLALGVSVEPTALKDQLALKLTGDCRFDRIPGWTDFACTILQDYPFTTLVVLPQRWPKADPPRVPFLDERGLIPFLATYGDVLQYCTTGKAQYYSHVVVLEAHLYTLLELQHLFAAIVTARRFNGEAPGQGSCLLVGCPELHPVKKETLGRGSALRHVQRFRSDDSSALYSTVPPDWLEQMLKELVALGRLVKHTSPQLAPSPPRLRVLGRTLRYDQYKVTVQQHEILKPADLRICYSEVGMDPTPVYLIGTDLKGFARDEFYQMIHYLAAQPLASIVLVTELEDSIETLFMQAFAKCRIQTLVHTKFD
jgi:hypothetical protein